MTAVEGVRPSLLRGGLPSPELAFTRARQLRRGPAHRRRARHGCPQLRTTVARRRRADYRNPNSCEEGVHRRKAPAPIRGGFAGAGVSEGTSAPTRTCSSKKIVLPIRQLRLTFSHRRREYYRNPNSGEKDTHRRTLVTPNR